MDNNLLSGLSNLGLGMLEGLEIYEDSEKKEEKEIVEQIPIVKEEDLLYDKKYVCPICDHEFMNKTVRATKLRPLETDMDLRPRFEHIDPLKYDAIVCNFCGYSGMGKSFLYLASSQKKAIKENISSSFKSKKADSNQKIYSYEEALERNKLALVNAIVMRSKASDKAYICLKTGWLVRGMAENLSPNEADYETRLKELESTENQFLKNAYEGLLNARESESFPIAGMDQVTLDYLLANLAMRFGEYDVASKLISDLLTSKNTPRRIKDKTRDLKEIVMKKIKEQKINE